MAKATGIYIAGDEVRVVELDGTLKRPRLAGATFQGIDSLAEPGSAGYGREVADSLKQLIKDESISTESMALGFPCREAVLRNLRVPFVGTEAIRKVVKFEVESEIHSHSVDEMVVDFYVRGERAGAETDVLVAAVPKPMLRERLEELEAVGIEPELVDLDTMALYRTALFCGVLSGAIDDPDEHAEGEVSLEHADGEEDHVPAVLETTPNELPVARVVIDAGAASVRIVAAATDGRLIEMRALRIGQDGVAAKLAQKFGISLADARDVLRAVLAGEELVEVPDRILPTSADSPPNPPSATASDSDDGDAEFAMLEAGEDGDDGESAGDRPVVINRHDVLAAYEGMLARLRRELMRFVTSLGRVSGIEAVFVTGAGATDSVFDVIGDVFGVEPRELDVLSRVPHSLDEEDADLLGSRIAVPFGLALGMLGAGHLLNFRREELVFARSFDRIKFPLGVACMMAAFLMFIYGIRLYKQLERHGLTYGTYRAVEDRTGRGTATRDAFSGFTGMIVNRDSQQYNPATFLDSEQDYEKLLTELKEADTFERVAVLKREFLDILTNRRAETGIYSDISVPSGFAVLARFAQVITGVQERLGSFQVTKVDLSMKQTVKSPATLKFKVSFRDPQFRSKYLMLKQAFESEFARPESPMARFKDDKTSEEPYSNPDGCWYDFTIELRDRIEPF